MKKHQVKKNFRRFVTNPDLKTLGMPIINALRRKIGNWKTELYFRKLLGIKSKSIELH